MSEKNSKSTTFELRKALGDFTKTSVFDKIMKEIDHLEIPSKYIDQVVIQYKDGTFSEIKGSDMSGSAFIEKSMWDKIEGDNQKIKDIRAFINVEKLECDVNKLVEDYLGKYC